MAAAALALGQRRTEGAEIMTRHRLSGWHWRRRGARQATRTRSAARRRAASSSSWPWGWSQPRRSSCSDTTPWHQTPRQGWNLAGSRGRHCDPLDPGHAGQIRCKRLVSTAERTSNSTRCHQCGKHADTGVASNSETSASEYDVWHRRARADGPDRLNSHRGGGGVLLS